MRTASRLPRSSSRGPRRVDDGPISHFLDAEKRAFAAHGMDICSVEVDLPIEPFRARVVRGGGQGDPLVLVHGGGAVPVLWAPLFPSLGAFEILAVELPGHGASTRFSFPDDADLPTFGARYLAAVMDAMGVPRAGLAASSLGGLWSFALARTYPERVSGLVQIGPTAFDGDPAVLTGRRLIAASRATGLTAWNDRRVRRILGAMGARFELDTDLVECLVALDRLPHHWRSLEILLMHMTRPTGALATDRSGSVAQIRTPTLLLLGETDLFAPSRALGGGGALPHAVLRSLPGGHLAWFHDPELVATEIESFLASQDRGPGVDEVTGRPIDPDRAEP